MISIRTIVVATLALAGCIEAGPVGSQAIKRAAGGDPGWALPWQTKAVYLMTNTADNSVIALPVAADGTLSEGTFAATGGSGGNLLNSMTGLPDAPDALSVQDSVRVVGNYLFAVNAGSNTVSMFTIDTDSPTNLTPVGSPQSTNGDFPVSIAASLDLNLVCVANTGLPSGVSCANFSASTGLDAFDTLREFSIGQTNPPTGPLNGVGDLLFNEDDSALILTVKGPAPNATGGFIATYPVANGAVFTEGTKYSPPSTALLFGAGLVPGSPNLLYASDAAFGAAILDLTDLSAAPLAITNVSGQAASCWGVVSSFTGSGFITDVGVNRLVETDLATGAIITEYYPPNPQPGMSDFQVAGDKIFVLSAGNGTTPAAAVVFDISGGKGSAKQEQFFVIPGADKNAMGLAIWPTA